MGKVTPTITNDGSSSLFSEQFNDHYHSQHGAVQEAMHVFIASGLNQFPQDESLIIFEMGFGTGLNCLLTLQNQQQRTIYYHSIEAYPLAESITQELNYKGEELVQVHEVDWNKEAEIQSGFYLKKYQQDVLEFQFPERIDLVYWDAFSPDKQPALWSQELFSKVFAVMSDAGILVTYSAKGDVRRSLLSAGFHVEKIPGPPGKREMLRALKNNHD